MVGRIKSGSLSLCSYPLMFSFSPPVVSQQSVHKINQEKNNGEVRLQKFSLGVVKIQQWRKEPFSSSLFSLK